MQACSTTGASEWPGCIFVFASSHGPVRTTVGSSFGPKQMLEYHRWELSKGLVVFERYCSNAFSIFYCYILVVSSVSLYVISSVYLHTENTNCNIKYIIYLIICSNRATHRVPRGHKVQPIPYPLIIGLPMGKTHGQSSRPIPYPFGSGAHGRSDPWAGLPALGRGGQKRVASARF
jgi:hypothetical protein